MAIPMVAYAMSASQALPIVAIWTAWGRRPPAPLGRLAGWCLLLLLADALDLTLAFTTGNNLWTSSVVLPLEVALLLWSLAPWQLADHWRRWYARGTWLVLAAGAAWLVAGVAASFTLVLGPVLSIIGLAASLHTLVARSLASPRALPVQEWFWVCLGLSLFWSLAVPLPPFAEAFLGSRVDWVSDALTVRALVSMGALFLITWGVVCRRVPALSPSRS